MLFIVMMKPTSRKVTSKDNTRAQVKEKHKRNSKQISDSACYSIRYLAYEVTSFLSTDCELSTNPCSRFLYSIRPRTLYSSNKQGGIARSTGTMECGLPTTWSLQKKTVLWIYSAHRQEDWVVDIGVDIGAHRQDIKLEGNT